MKTQNILSILVLFFSAVSLAGAQVTDIFSAELSIYDLIVKLQYLFWAIAVAVFFWGLVKFMTNAGDTAAHEKGKEFIVWGIISFVVLVSVWGLVQLIAGDILGYTSSPVYYRDKTGTIVL
jgi:hypothetical protein